MTVTTFEEMPAYVVFGAVSPLGSGPWRMIWCHERCHKAENEARRVRMESTVRHHSGTLISFKKARQVGRWASRASRPPFVLVTDWREAQPCVIELQSREADSHPALMVVLCEGPQQLKKASAWARSASTPFRLEVCMHKQIPSDLLGGLIMRCFDAEDCGVESPEFGDAAVRLEASQPESVQCVKANFDWAGRTADALAPAVVAAPRPPPGLEDFLSDGEVADPWRSWGAWATLGAGGDACDRLGSSDRSSATTAASADLNECLSFSTWQDIFEPISVSENITCA